MRLISNPYVRAAIAAAALALLVLFIVPVSRNIINIGNIFGGAVCIGLAAMLIFFEGFQRVIAVMRECRIGRIALIAVTASAVIFVLYAAVISVFMARAANDKPKNPETTLVVLGCKVKGNYPSLMLQHRLEAAYDYLKLHDDVNVVVSGGKGDDELISEAQCMRDYLVGKGISADRIFMEDKSTNTEENLEFSKKLIEREGLCADITIVTDGYHQLRAELLAKRIGFSASNISADTTWWLVPTYWVREWFGLAYYGIFG